jgi:hypothetical protein
MTFLALAGRAAGIPGGLIQGKDEGTLVTLHPGGNAGDAKFRPLGGRPLAHKVKVSLDPFIVKVSDFTNLQVDLDDLGRVISNGIIERNVQDGLGYRKLMHEEFRSIPSFHGFYRKIIKSGKCL